MKEIIFVSGASRGIGKAIAIQLSNAGAKVVVSSRKLEDCLLYTSPSPRDRQKSRMPSSA